MLAKCVPVILQNLIGCQLMPGCHNPVSSIAYASGKATTKTHGRHGAMRRPHRSMHDWNSHLPTMGTERTTRLPMGAKCGKATYCCRWNQRSNYDCGLFKQFSGVGSREAHLPQSTGGKLVINA